MQIHLRMVPAISNFGNFNFVYLTIGIFLVQIKNLNFYFIIIALIYNNLCSIKRHGSMSYEILQQTERQNTSIFNQIRLAKNKF